MFNKDFDQFGSMSQSPRDMCGVWILSTLECFFFDPQTNHNFYLESDMGWFGPLEFYPENWIWHFAKILKIYPDCQGFSKKKSNFYPDLTTASKGAFKGPTKALSATNAKWIF
jgi:hypothetical protein